MSFRVLALPGDVVLQTAGGDVLGGDIPLFASASLSGGGGLIANGTLVENPIKLAIATLGGSGALSVNATRIDTGAAARAAALDKQGHYRPLTWPSYGRPWRQ